MAWLTGYSKRKEITLTGGASGAQTAFQLKLAVSYVAAMDGDFDDLRFTQADGTTLVDAWAELIVTDTSATVWVEFPTTPANTVEQTYYMYYGHATPVSDWSGANTFIQYHGAASADFLDAAVITPASYVYEVKARTTSTTANNTIWGISNHAVWLTGDKCTIQSYTPSNLVYHQTRNSGSGTNVSEAPKLTVNQWYAGKIVYDGTNTHGYWDGNEIGAGISLTIPDENMGLFMDEYAGSGEQEWSFARKYAANPPTYAFGAEESVPTGIARSKVNGGLASRGLVYGGLIS